MFYHVRVTTVTRPATTAPRHPVTCPEGKQPGTLDDTVGQVQAAGWRKLMAGDVRTLPGNLSHNLISNKHLRFL